MGTLIGDIDRLVSAPVHSSVSGTVEKIDKILMPDGQYVDAVFIDSDGEMTPDPKLKAPVIKTKEDLISALSESTRQYTVFIINNDYFLLIIHKRIPNIA